MATHIHLWADWIGSLPTVPRFAVGALAILIVAVLYGAAYAVVDHVLTYLLHSRVRLRFETPTPEPERRQELGAVVNIATRERVI